MRGGPCAPYFHLKSYFGTDCRAVALTVPKPFLILRAVGFGVPRSFGSEWLVLGCPAVLVFEWLVLVLRAC